MMGTHVLKRIQPYRTLVTVMFNRCKPCFIQAIHVLLMHSLLVVAFFFSECILVLGRDVKHFLLNSQLNI